jgi:hypothetical protein
MSYNHMYENPYVLERYDQAFISEAPELAGSAADVGGRAAGDHRWINLQDSLSLDV